MKRVYALKDTAGVFIAATALCGNCIHDTGQKLAALETGAYAVGEDGPAPVQFHDTAGQYELPCYICGHEFCQQFEDDGSCIHSDHTP